MYGSHRPYEIIMGPAGSNVQVLSSWEEAWECKVGIATSGRGRRRDRFFRCSQRYGKWARKGCVEAFGYVLLDLWDYTFPDCSITNFHSEDGWTLGDQVDSPLTEANRVWRRRDTCQLLLSKMLKLLTLISCLFLCFLDVEDLVFVSQASHARAVWGSSKEIRRAFL